MLDVVVAAERVTYQLQDVAFIDAGETKQLKIKGALEEEDLEDNEFVNVKMYYGQRQNSLVKVFEGRFPLLVLISAFSMVSLASYAGLAVIVLFIALLLWKIYFAKKFGKS
jgi:hypothetical protein